MKKLSLICLVFAGISSAQIVNPGGGGGGTGNATAPTITSIYTESLSTAVGERHKRYTIPYTALTAASTTQDIALATIPAGTVIDKVVVVEGTQFVGITGLTSMTIAVGRGASSPSDFMLPSPVMQAASNTTTSGGALVPNGLFGSSYTLYIEFANTTATSPVNLGTGSATSLTAGSLTVDIWFSN